MSFYHFHSYPCRHPSCFHLFQVYGISIPQIRILLVPTEQSLTFTDFEIFAGFLRLSVFIFISLSLIFWCILNRLYSKRFGVRYALYRIMSS